ncbi:envelope stress response membrane protein PspC [Dokdonella sp.]|uniref:envelope stress response membrane protein PspC n=1 Tax=Dokdonella sp. TaxID=2291710 RepID=UPI0031CB56C3|nr:envelope stress response membrane protein PspC [Dokdonella sp.]
MRQDNRWRAQRFYRDPQNGKLMGVCAGLADYFGWNVTLVRILAVIALLWLNVVTLIAYVVLGILLPTKPERPYDWDTGDEYWRSVRRSASATFRDVRQNFRELDLRLQRMESYVTSRHYDLDRKFRDLER